MKQTIGLNKYNSVIQVNYSPTGEIIYLFTFVRILFNYQGLIENITRPNQQKFICRLNKTLLTKPDGYFIYN